MKVSPPQAKCPPPATGRSTRRRSKRRKGYAGAAVAQVSQIFLDAGARVCLYTDQANPTSNGVYQAIGYRAVVDQVNLRIVRG